MSEAAVTMDVDPQAARAQMIQQQLRTWDVLDDEVLQVFAAIDREHFVPAAYGSLAYADLAVPLGAGEHMLQPKVAGRIVQAVKPGVHDRVLEIGTGSGYLAAALGKLACSVRSIESRPDQAETARASLQAAGLRNVQVITADAFDDTALGDLLYDVVVVGGSLPRRESRFEAKVALGGRLFAVIGDGPVMSATLLERTGESEWRETVLFETLLKPLHGVTTPSKFHF